MATIITGTGAYIPTVIVPNKDFAVHHFYAQDHTRIETPPLEVTQKLQQITGIAERRYASPNLNASDIGAMAARKAIEDSGIDPETLDQLIVAHNFGNVVKDTIQTDAVPSLASRIKHILGIRNPRCVAHDLLFGCPGWVQGVIHANAYFKSGMARRALVIGTETLSRVIDPYDRDSMIFSDGAGAAVLECREGTDGSGILSTTALSHSMEEVYYIAMGASYFPGSDPGIRYMKMNGRKVYQYAIKYVAEAMKDCLDTAGITIKELKKVFLHQANEKMDEGIIRELYKLYGASEIPHDIMPMSIQWLGNSSVATVPTLYDLVKRNQLPDHSVNKGDVVLFASVGAGMNINAICYRL